MQAESPRLEALSQLGDGRALSRRIPSLEYDDGGELGLPAGPLESMKARLEVGKASFVLGFRELESEVEGFEHDGAPDSWRISRRRFCHTVQRSRTSLQRAS